MKGFHAAQLGHIIPLFSGNVAGGKTTVAFSMKGAAHASIIIAFGALTVAPTDIQLFQCTDATGSNAVAMPFNLFAAETASGNSLGILDSMGSRIPVLAAGYTPAGVYPGSFYSIEVDASELNVDDAVQTTTANGVTSATFGTLPGYAYLQVVIGASATATPAAIVAILSGLDIAGELQPSALV